MKKNFSCQKGSMTIRGYEIYEENDNHIPVILSHGFMGNMKATEPYALELAKKGFHAFIYDFCGGGFETISDGSFHEYMTPFTEVDDLKTVIQYVQGREDLDADKLILLGNSQGGFVSSIVASELQNEVKNLILVYPALCIPDDARKGKMQMIEFDPDNIPPHVGFDRFMICGAYPRSVKYMNIYEVMKKYHGDVLLLHGTADTIVDYQYSVKANESYQSEGTSCEFHLIEGAGHGFREKYFDEAMAFINNYLDKKVSGL